ncbi:hypothetical protein LEMLEM_LOCUS15557, partial [Lemmus lemmus]
MASQGFYRLDRSFSKRQTSFTTPFVKGQKKTRITFSVKKAGLNSCRTRR